MRLVRMGLLLVCFLTIGGCVEAQTTIRVNAGAGNYTDSAGQLWQADTGFYGGGPESYATPVTGTADGPLFQTYRWNPTGYAFTVANGTYQVSFCFTENAPVGQSVGARVFSVTLQGVTAFANLDIFRESGANAALIKTATATVSNGKLTIGFVPVSGLSPKVSAIQIVSSGGTPADTTAPTVSVTSPASGATVSGTISLAATASDNVSVAGVQFQVDGSNSSAEDTSAPYLVSLDTTTLANGSHSFAAVARDAAGNRTTSTAVNISVSNSSGGGGTGIAGSLRVLASNPRYFTDGTGKAIYLTGSHTWGNLMDQGTSDPPSVFDYSAYLDFLQAHNHNFFRLWTWTLPQMNDPQRSYSSPMPWLRPGPGTATDGKLKFDLNQYNQNYFDRMRQRVIAAGQRGIYVSVMLFDGYDLQYYREGNDGDPFAGGNNVNGIDCPGTCPHDASQSAAVTAIEQAYLRKVIDTVNDLDNVLYEVANEAGGYSKAWQYNVINYVKQYEATKAKQHPVGMTYDYYGGTDADLYASPADWISPHELLPTSSGQKVIVNDTDHSYNWNALKGSALIVQEEWVWENFMQGNSTLFMDPYLVVWPQRNAPSATTPDPYWETIRTAMGRTRSYAVRVNLAAMTPQPTLTTAGYCLANAGSEYLFYKTSSGAYTATMVAGTYSYEWYNPDTGVVVSTGFITLGGGTQTFTPPFSGDSLLYLKRQ